MLEAPPFHHIFLYIYIRSLKLELNSFIFIFVYFHHVSFIFQAVGTAQVPEVMSFVVPMIFLFVWYQVAKSLITRENKWTAPRRRWDRLILAP